MYLPTRYQYNHFIRLFIPLLLTQVAQIGSSVFSSIFSGLAGTIDLAGVAVGANIWIPVFAGLSGVFYGITPIIAQLRGAHKLEQIPVYIQQSLIISLTFAVITVTAGYLLLPPFLEWLDLESAVLYIAKGYLQVLSFGIFPLFLMATLRNVLDAHGKTHISMFLISFNLVLSVALFRLFIFGGLGIPALGGIGTAYAITVSAWISLLLFIGIFQFYEPFKDYQVWRHFYGIRLLFCIEQLRLGIPIAVAIFCETSLFSMVALLMSEFGTVYLAANQAAVSYSTLVYTLPWAISLTATIVVGYEVGARQYDKAKQYAVLCQLTALCCVCFTALATYLFINPVAEMFTNDYDTFVHIRTFLFYAIGFSFCDALGTPVQGILRGYKDVKSVSYIAIVMYWIVCLPLGYYLAHFTGLGAYGYWLGYIIGLAIAALSYNARLWKHTVCLYKRSDFDE